MLLLFIIKIQFRNLKEKKTHRSNKQKKKKIDKPNWEIQKPTVLHSFNKNPHPAKKKMETGEFANSTTRIFENIEIKIVSPVYEQKKKERKEKTEHAKMEEPNGEK